MRPLVFVDISFDSNIIRLYVSDIVSFLPTLIKWDVPDISLKLLSMEVLPSYISAVPFLRPGLYMTIFLLTCEDKVCSATKMSSWDCKGKVSPGFSNSLWE